MTRAWNGRKLPVGELERPRVMIAGERSGVGKSTLAIGIIRALRSRGLAVQPFKSGPDFLDPMHHLATSGRCSRNLDTWMFPDYVLESFMKASRGADVSVIEGAMGLYDGYDGLSEAGSASHLSKLLRCPVILLVDAAACARSAGAVVMGFKQYDHATDIAGVIFNNVAGPKHLKALETSLRGVECLGGMPRDQSIALSERHLGLVPSTEEASESKYERIQALSEERLAIDRILQIARSAPPLPDIAPPRSQAKEQRCEIAIARDAAFNFYYEDNFDILRERGASLLFFSPLEDRLPEADGYYLGGGYPEVFAERLSENSRLMTDLRRASDVGVPVYAECGGLMYLCSGITDTAGKHFGMCGVFKASAEMTGSLQALSYVKAKVVRDNILARKGWSTRGHVFHFSRVVEMEEPRFSYELEGGTGIDGPMDGLVSKSTLASYTHLHFGSCPDFAERLVRACATNRD